MVNFKELVRACEADIRAGLTDQAALRLRELPTAKIPDDLRFTFANLCRRTGLVSIGLKALTPPHLRDRAEWLVSVGPAEKAEYALLLQRIGSVNEAMRILDGVDAAAFPDALLYRAYCHFNRWEYAEAIPLLEKYVAGPLDEYKLLTGRVNLVAALVSTGAPSASAELAALLKACESGGHVRLSANCHELRAQLALAATDLGAAKDAIAAALGILSPAKTLDQLFAKKLQAVMTAVESGRTGAMEEFRREALDRMDWESARDIDFYMLKLDFSYERFEHLIFGTPFAAYRERVCQALGRRILKETYVFGDGSGPVMDVAKAEIAGMPCLTVGGKIHQMLEILLRDFYRPKTLAALFSELFPNDHFDIFSSPDRVHQILRRTRAWLTEAGLPAEIVEIDRYYQIQVTGKFGFRLNLDRAPLDWNLVHFRRLKCIASPDRLYTPRELREKLGLGLTPFRRFATWAMEEGKLERSGIGSTTVYRLTGSSY